MVLAFQTTLEFTLNFYIALITNQAKNAYFVGI